MNQPYMTQPYMNEPHLWTAITRTARGLGDRHGIRFLGFGVPDVEIPYERFLGMAAWLGDRMPAAAGPRPETLVIGAANPLPTLVAFFAALATNRRPLILPGPSALGGTEPFLQRLRDVLARSEGYCLLGLERGLVPDGALPPGVRVVVLPTDAADYGARPPTHSEGLPGGDEVAYLQMTSASTGDSKLVAVSHANAHANLAGLRSALHVSDDMRMGTWLPLYHDMGLVGTTLLSFYCGWPMYLMKPTEFIMRPYRWIDALSRFRCTVTAAPNFGYDHAQRLVTEAQIEGCDLSALASAVVGAEPIRLATLNGFRRRFGGHGFRANAFVCAYGMAESTLAASMTLPSVHPRYLLVNPAHTTYGQPVPVVGEGILGSGDEPIGDHKGVAVFSVGAPLDGLDIGIVDEDGSALAGEGVLGEIVLRGSSVSAGYFDYATARPKPFPDGVLPTGDIGFRRDGELFILDRKKHVIIRHGRNYLASLAEDRVARVLGVPADRLIVVDADVHDPASDILVLVENHAGNTELEPDQVAELREVDLPIDAVHFFRKRIIPRTTSGKKKYDQTRRWLAAQPPTGATVRLSARVPSR